MAKSRSYSMDEEILEMYGSMIEELKKISKKPIELILETALNSPDKLRDYLITGAASFPPFDISKGFNNTEFINMLLDPAGEKLLYNLIILTNGVESKIAKNSYAKVLSKGGKCVLLVKHDELSHEHYVEINITDILDVDLFDTINMKSESYKYIKEDKQLSYIYVRLKMHKVSVWDEVKGYG